MNATVTRGRRILAVLTTAGALLLPATAATAAPPDHAAERAGEAQAANEERRDERPDREDSTTPTEDDDSNDGGTPNNVADDGDDAHPSGRDRSVESGGSGNQGSATSDPDDDGRGPDRSNGGADRPDGPGGVDLADQDGNNGCGNDDDFEDDNEGWCGRPPRDEAADDTASDEDVEQDVDAAAVRDVEEDDEREPARSDVRGTTVTRTPYDDCPVPMTGSASGEGCDVVEQGVLSAGATRTTTGDTAVLGVAVDREDAPAATTGVLGAAFQEDGEDEEATEVAAEGTLPRTGAGLAGLAAFGLSALAGGSALARRRR